MKKHLLIAGNNCKSLLVLKKTFEAFENEFAVETAGDFKSLLGLVRQKTPDVILLDYTKMDPEAIAIAGLIKQHRLTKGIPVIMTTDFTSSKNIQKAIDAGIIDFIRRPVERSELLIKIKTVIKHSHLLQENIQQSDKLRKLSLVADRSDNSIIIYDVNGKVEWVNDAFEKIYGYRPGCGQNPSTPDLAGSEEKLLNALSKCREESKWVAYEHCLTGKDGEKKWIHTSLTPVLNESGKIENFIAVETEITKLKLAETRLKKQNNELIKLSVNLEQTNKKLAEQRQEIQEQNKEIERQKKTSDNLLLNLFPYEIAEQLKVKGTATPKHYRIVSVMFTDFVGFSELTEITPVHELIKELNIYFESFDEIIKRHFIEKIKTIGDSYMCAGGIPLRNRSNPIDTVLAAMEIQNFVNSLNTQKSKSGIPLWRIRIGIHTGEVIAGVIGKQKMAYDIWGKTVNTASQMESNGETGKINISESTYNQIKEFFDCTYRGKISVKHQSPVDMYFVEGLKPKYSADQNGFKPNNAFKKILTEY